jgi:hypothetical protein
MNYTRIMTLLFLLTPLTATPAVKRESSEPYISGDSFRTLADHIFDETHPVLDPSSIQECDIIFVKTDYLDLFFHTKHPRIAHRYILITHNSDYGAPGEYASFLEDEKVIVWFGQNPTIRNHPKFIPIPIGFANQCWPHGNIQTVTTVLNQNLSQEKQYLLGINFRPGTNNAIRKPIYDYFIRQPFCTDIETDHYEQYLINCARTQFILSPAGNGLDCHRTWEALVMGSIPIVESSCLDPLLHDLPVLIITDWKQINPAYLEEQYKKTRAASYNREKLYFSYWKTLILSYKKKH